MTDKQEISQDMKKIKILKGVVIIMTSLIFFGIGAVLYSFATRHEDDKQKQQEHKQQILKQQTNKLFFGLSENSKISSYVKKDDYLFVHAKEPKSSDKLYVIDIETGKIISVIDTGKN